MLLSDFDYHLPEDLIAQEPLVQRDSSRMLVVNRQSQTFSDSTFNHFPDHIRSHDVVVVNNSRVIPARLVGRRHETGGRVEIFLVREISPTEWDALIRPGGRLKSGSLVDFDEPRITAEIVDEPGAELRRVRFHCDGNFEELLGVVGSTPLPPYIKRPQGASAEDRDRYQTIYSKNRGAIAAPTAGLHFTPAVLSQLKNRAKVVELTLHVGYGTFEPVRVEDIKDHTVSSERFTVSNETAEAINSAKKNGGRVIAVGTTTVRALESAVTSEGIIAAGFSETALTIKPGHDFKIVDALLTNFHLPRSSLLILVSAFAGREFILNAYHHAVAERYRFYSYGDCMLIL